jgi:hypothetical protein
MMWQRRFEPSAVGAAKRKDWYPSVDTGRLYSAFRCCLQGDVGRFPAERKCVKKLVYA